MPDIPTHNMRFYRRQC